jgi:hypothetical protein
MVGQGVTNDSVVRIYNAGTIAQQGHRNVFDANAVGRHELVFVGRFGEVDA